jgi:hypothetical protein
MVESDRAFSANNYEVFLNPFELGNATLLDPIFAVGNSALHSLAPYRVEKRQAKAVSLSVIGRFGEFPSPIMVSKLPPVVLCFYIDAQSALDQSKNN